MNTEKRAEQLTEYLRGLSATLADPMLEDAADLIDELLAALYVECDKLAQYEAPDPNRHQKPKLSDSPALRASLERSTRRSNRTVR